MDLSQCDLGGSSLLWYLKVLCTQSTPTQSSHQGRSAASCCLSRGAILARKPHIHEYTGGMNEQPLEIERELLSALVTMIRQWGSLTADWGFARSAGVEVSDNLIRIIVTLGATADDFRPSDMAEHLGMSRTSLSKSLTSLRAEGLISGAAAPDDRRAVHVSLTPAGKEAYKKILTAGMEEMRKVSSTFTHDELCTVTRFMTSFVSALEEGAPHILPINAN